MYIHLAPPRAEVELGYVDSMIVIYENVRTLRFCPSILACGRRSYMFMYKHGLTRVQHAMMQMHSKMRDVYRPGFADFRNMHDFDSLRGGFKFGPPVPHASDYQSEPRPRDENGTRQTAACVQGV